MSPLLHFVRKEWLQLVRDRQALLLLFLMPIVFILIMSLAMQQRFDGQRRVALDFGLVDYADTEISAAFINDFLRDGIFRRQAVGVSEDELRRMTRRDELKFTLVIDPDFAANIGGREEAVRIELAPGTDAPLALLAQAHLRRAVARVYLAVALGPAAGPVDLDAAQDAVAVESLYTAGSGPTVRPSSVQQNVPAWLLFAMFFVAVPLSTVMIAERTNGTLARLTTMQFPRRWLFVGKMLPFFALNLAQVALMLIVGVFVVPLFGGDRLSLGASPTALILISVAASLAAVCYGLMIAQLARTNEQATIFCGVCNIIMAAIGGVMVPRFLMPPAMQELSQLSPMYWGLEGFLDVLLRGGTARDVLVESVVLIAFAFSMLLTAIFVSQRRRIE